jgi:hypothetical protein
MVSWELLLRVSRCRSSAGWTGLPAEDSTLTVPPPRRPMCGESWPSHDHRAMTSLVATSDMARARDGLILAYRTATSGHLPMAECEPGAIRVFLLSRGMTRDRGQSPTHGPTWGRRCLARAA